LRESQLIETYGACGGSKIMHMKDTLRRAVLNPAFKRFQYLPVLPIGGTARHACAAPPAGDTRRVSHASDTPDAQCARDIGNEKGRHAGTPPLDAETRGSPPTSSRVEVRDLAN